MKTCQLFNAITNAAPALEFNFATFHLSCRNRTVQHDGEQRHALSQRTFSANQQPAPGTVQVWEIALDMPASVVAGAQACLPEVELVRAKAFRDESTKHRHILAHAALRCLLAHKLRCNPREITFQIGPFGKPALPAERHAALHFNLSHSGELALVALCDAAEVGVDIEHIRPVRDPIALAKRFFTPGEQDELAAAPPEDQINCFFRLWTQKEALLKATGQGIANGLQRFEVTCRGGGGLVAMDGEKITETEWSLANWSPHAEYVAGCAVYVRNATIALKPFSFADI